MKAVICRHAELAVADLAEPTPGRGQVRLEVLRCGICGSDLHARHGMDAWADMAARNRLALRGDLDPRPLITGTVGLDGVDAAFTALADPEAHAKVLIDPRA
jgi:threonine dehydrogenase-like Zn-dependent dehydrogenase